MFEDIFLIPRWFMAIFFFIYGSFFGSFANVLIYRIQRNKALYLLKRSYCPHCFYNIPFYLNIPILSWFILWGRCRNCGNSLSFRYPLVEFLMSVLFSALFLAIGWKWFLLEAFIFVFGLLCASFIDWDQMILPDSFTLSGICIGLLGAWLNPDRVFMDALFGMLLGGGSLLAISWIYYLARGKEGMGGGDIKLMAWIGAVLSWESLFFIIFISCLLGSLAGFGMILHSNKKDLQTAFPFGPYLAVSSVFYIFLNVWGKNYINFFIPFSFF